MKTDKIAADSRVTLHYTLETDDGLMAESTKETGPETIALGQGEIIDGLEQCLIGLKVGDKKRFEVDCMNAFGPIDEDTVHDIPRSEFPKAIELEPGLVVNFEAPNGDETPGIIAEIGDDTVKVDFNHPLAGYDLIFNVEILGIAPADEHD